MDSVAAINRQDLMAHNDAFRQLSQEHSALETQLSQLRERRFLSSEEEVEELRLKKRKLQLKDEMEALLRRSLSPAGSA
ncbi:MAG: YdcH family protein [Terriglobales bacterium]